MGKKSLKSTRQIYMLKRYLEQRTDKWPKEEVIKLANQIHLSRAQVYKWLWDQRNLLRQMQKIQPQQPHSNIYLNYLPFAQDKPHSKPDIQTSQNYRTISLRSHSQDSILQVPQTLEFAVKIKIPRTTRSNFKTILRNYGSELTRMKTNDSYETPEKQPRIPQVNEFHTVPQIKYSSRS